MKRAKQAVNFMPAIPFFILVIAFLLLPLLNMVISGFRHPETGAFTLQNFVDVFTKPIYYMSIINSLRMSVFSTIVGLVLAFFAALCITSLSDSGRKRYMPILNMTQNFTGFPLAFAFMLMVGRSGFLVLAAKQHKWPFLPKYNLYSAKGMIPLFIYFAIPLGTLLLIPGFSAVKKEWKEAATLLEANAFQFWIKVGLPVLAPTLLGTLSMVFADSITTFTTVYMLMDTNFASLPLKISIMYSGDSKQQTELGAALSMTMIGIILLVMGATNLAKRFLVKGARRT